MKITDKHTNEHGDTEYTMTAPFSVKSCKPYRNENGDMEITVTMESKLCLAVPGKVAQA